MDEIRKIIVENLGERIQRVRDLADAAETCLNDGDFLQAAVRLQSLLEPATFDTIYLNILDCAHRG